MTILDSGAFNLDFDKIEELEVVNLGTDTTNNPAVQLTISDVLSDGQSGNETIAIHGDGSDKVTVVDTASTTVTETAGASADNISIALDGSNSAVIDTILVDNTIAEQIVQNP